MPTRTITGLTFLLFLIGSAPWLSFAQANGCTSLKIALDEPVDGASNVDSAAPLTLRVIVILYDAATCAHVSTYWQVATDPNFNNVVFDSGWDVGHKTSITLQPVPNSNLLTAGTQYWWRIAVRYQDLNLQSEFDSGWTTASSFTTMGIGGGMPTPQITALSPSNGGPGTRVTVQGFGFLGDPLNTTFSRVLFDGQEQPTTFIDGSTLEFQVPAGAACGDHTVAVVNDDSANPILFPPTSNSVTFTVVCLTLPLQITGLSPSSGGPGTWVTVQGFGFLGDPLNTTFSRVLFDGQEQPTTFIDGSTLEFQVPAGAACGDHTVAVVNDDSVNPILFPPTSNEVTFTVTCAGNPGNPPLMPTPQIDRLNPSSGPAGTSVTVLGRDFALPVFGVGGGAEVLFDGHAVVTTVRGNAELDFTVPVNAACGAHDVQVQNVDPATIFYPLSNIVSFTVTCPGGPGNPGQPGPPPGGGNRAPTAAFSYSPSQPTAGQSVRFSNQSSDPDGAADIAAVRWDFGDGATSAEVHPTHTFQQAGTYTVKLTVTDHAGRSDTISRTITVVAAGAPPAGDPIAAAVARLVPFDPNKPNADSIIGDREILKAVTFWIKSEAVPNAGGQKIDDRKILDLIKRWINGVVITASAPVTVSDARARGALERLSRQLNRVSTPASGGAQTGRAPQPVQAAWDPVLLEEVRLQPLGSDRWQVRARGQNVHRLTVQVFDASGRLVKEQTASGSRLTLISTDRWGRLLPNGTYLYVVIAYDARGNVARSEVRKFTVLR